MLIGDSITANWIGCDPRFFADHTLLNRGVGGQVSADIAARFEADVLRHRPGAVAILAGTNDIAGNAGPFDMDATCANLERMTALATEAGIKVVLCAVPPAFQFPWSHVPDPRAAISALNLRLRALAASHGLSFADYFTPMADPESGMRIGLSSDGVHPNLAGYKVMEPVLLKALSGGPHEAHQAAEPTVSNR